MSETGTASTELERLNTVQTLDSELDALKLEEASIPTDLKAAREEKLRLETDLSRTREDHSVVRREYSSADLELKDLSAKRDKSRQDQKQAMSAKEQSQYEAVIMQLSGRIEELENDALPLVERMEALETKIVRRQNDQPQRTLRRHRFQIAARVRQRAQIQTRHRPGDDQTRRQMRRLQRGLAGQHSATHQGRGQRHEMPQLRTPPVERPERLKL
jgi:predicted  nucleic acid-binding Zn-ribbon protein